MAAAAEDYTWFVETQPLGFSFSLAMVRGFDPDEVIAQLGGPEPVDIAGSALLGPAGDVGGALPDPDSVDATVSTGLVFIATASTGGWTMIVELFGYLCATPSVVGMLSSRGEMVSFQYNEYASSRVFWARDGSVAVGFEPNYPPSREGSEPDRLNDILVEVGFPLENSEDAPYDSLYRQRALALMERLTGVQITPELLAEAAYRCAFVPESQNWRNAPLDPFGFAPFVTEVQELLADYAADPADATNQHKFEWSERGVTDRRVRVSGHYGLQLFDADRDLLRAIAHAPPELEQRLVRWLQDRPFHEAGILDEPWFAPIREALHGGPPVSKADLRAAEQHLEAQNPADHRAGPGRRALRSLRYQPASSTDTTAMICILMNQLAGFRSAGIAMIAADLRQAFPELHDVEIPEQPPERDRARRRRETRERAREQQRSKQEAADWGGRGPGSDRLRQTDGWGTALARIDRALVDEIADANPQQQRAMAVWAARYTCEKAGLLDRDWITDAVQALEHGNPAPPSFVDFDIAYLRWRGVSADQVTGYIVGGVFPAGQKFEPPTLDPAIYAITTVISARHDDSLIAALDTVHQAIQQHPDQQVTIAAFRTAFPPPDTGQPAN